MTEMIIKELSTFFMNLIRVTKPAGTKAQSLQDWRKDTVPQLTRALTRNPEMTMWKFHRATFEIIYKDMGNAKRLIDHIKETMKGVEVERDMFVLSFTTWRAT